jgi:hypothetical protein
MVSGGKSDDARYNAPEMHLKKTGFIIGMPSTSAILVEHAVAMTDGARCGRLTVEQRDKIIASAG